MTSDSFSAGLPDNRQRWHPHQRSQTDNEIRYRPSSAFYELNHALQYLGHVLYTTFYSLGHMQYLFIHSIYHAPPLAFFDPQHLFFCCSCMPSPPRIPKADVHLPFLLSISIMFCTVLWCLIARFARETLLTTYLPILIQFLDPCNRSGF